MNALPRRFRRSRLVRLTNRSLYNLTPEEIAIVEGTEIDLVEKPPPPNPENA